MNRPTITAATRAWPDNTVIVTIMQQVHSLLKDTSRNLPQRLMIMSWCLTRHEANYF
jgi:hypothetical protein